MLSWAETVARIQALPRLSFQGTRWIVLTGAPATGKSTVLEQLSAKGYATHREQARALLEAEIAAGRTLK